MKRGDSLRSDFRLGDKVIFDKSNGNDNFKSKGLLTNFGIIINKNDIDTYHIMYFDDCKISIAYYISDDYIKPIEDNTYEQSRIEVYYEKLIEDEKKKLKTVSQEEKDKQKVERYENIKQRIIRNCEWCVTKDLDDEDFVNRVKEIANLKKQLFSPERLPCMNEIHRYNGTIKYNIRELEYERDKLLKQISDEEIELRLGKF
jgi:hypothetical protein